MHSHRQQSTRTHTALVPLLLSGLLLLVLPLHAGAQIGDNLEIHGFVMGNFTGRLSDRRPADAAGDFLLAEERLRLDLATWANSIDVSAQVRADFLHDAVAGEFDIDVREAYVDYVTGDFDFRLGRQIATWGVGDLVFINDVFPKNWASFFSGRPLEYLKTGLDGFKTRFSSSTVNVELMIIPFFTPDTLPESDRFVIPDPLARVPDRDERMPRQTYGNTEVAMRLYRRIGNFDVSFYTYRGFWRVPGFELDHPVDPERVTRVYPQLRVYGASAQTNFMGGVLSLEAGHYRSRKRETRKTVGVPDSQERFLAGYQKEVRQDFNLGVQYFAEIDSGTGLGNPYRDTVTLRMDRLLRHQTWKLSLFGFFSPQDLDYLLQPQVSYKFSDEFNLAVGGNIFGGSEGTFLGRFDGNDNLYTSFRFDF